MKGQIGGHRHLHKGVQNLPMQQMSISHSILFFSFIIYLSSKLVSSTPVVSNYMASQITPPAIALISPCSFSGANSLSVSTFSFSFFDLQSLLFNIGIDAR